MEAIDVLIQGGAVGLALVAFGLLYWVLKHIVANHIGDSTKAIRENTGVLTELRDTNRETKEAIKELTREVRNNRKGERAL